MSLNFFASRPRLDWAALGWPVLRACRAIGVACLIAVCVVHLWRERGASIRALHAMDDRMLTDIGITRSEIQGAVTRSFRDH